MKIHSQTKVKLSKTKFDVLTRDLYEIKIETT